MHGEDGNLRKLVAPETTMMSSQDKTKSIASAATRYGDLQAGGAGGGSLTAHLIQNSPFYALFIIIKSFTYQPFFYKKNPQKSAIKYGHILLYLLLFRCKTFT